LIGCLSIYWSHEQDQLEQTGLPVDHNLKEIFSRTFQSVDDKLKEHEFQAHHFLLSIAPVNGCG